MLQNTSSEYYWFQHVFSPFLTHTVDLPPHMSCIYWLCWARHCHRQIQWATCVAWHWGSGPHSEERRLRWYGHVECSNGAVGIVFDLQVGRKHGPGRPKMTMKQLTKRDRRAWMLSAIDPHDRCTRSWRSDLVWDLPCVQQASYLEGSPLMWMLPLYLHVNKKSDDDDDNVGV